MLIEGFPAVSLEGIIRMKEKLGREKDLKDIALIKQFMEKINQSLFLLGQ